MDGSSYEQTPADSGWYPDLGSLSADVDFLEEGSCWNNAEASAALFPPREVGGTPLSLEEWYDLLTKGLVAWCTSCPIMRECGEAARDWGWTGPYGGRLFFEGREIGSTHRQARELPGEARRLYTAALGNNERASHRHCHDLLARGFAQHPWQEEPSYLPPLPDGVALPGNR